MSEDKPMKFHVKGSIRDLLAFMNLVSTRRKRIQKADTKAMEPPFINILANELHPSRQFAIIKEVIEESKTTKTFRLIPDHDAGTQNLAYFRAGQYVSVKANIKGTEITRPYSIASSPKDALDGFYDITIKRQERGFLTTYIWENWQVGTKVILSGPLGFMYYDNLRDSNNLVGIGGGSGITPFRSMAREICYGKLNAKLTLLYGCSSEDDIIYKKEFDNLMQIYPDKFSVIYVMSCDIVNMKGCEQGFISSEIIKKYSDIQSDTYCLCGPAVMYDFIEKELDVLGVSKKQIRREAYGEIKDPSKFETYPKEYLNKEFKVNVHIINRIVEIEASSNESVLVAMERAKLAPPSACRSGECQFCRSKLISGNIWVSPESDGRRKADIKYGYFHPCASFPLSDLSIELPKTDK